MMHFKSSSFYKKFLLSDQRRFIFLFLLLLIPSLNAQSFPSTDERNREKIANTILDFMNLAANPCEDFFNFACGNFSNNHTPKRYGEIITPQSELEMQVNIDFQNILRTTRDMFGKSLQNFYDSCIQVDRTSEQQKQFMTQFLKEVGGITPIPTANNNDWILNLATLRKNFGIEAMIGFEIGPGPDSDNRNSNNIYLGEPKTTIISAENCSAVAIETQDEPDDSYEILENEISQNLQKWVSMNEDKANRLGKDIISFEYDLCKMMRLEQTLSETTTEGAEMEEEQIQNYMNNNNNNRRNGGYNRSNRNRRAGGYNRSNQYRQLKNQNQYRIQNQFQNQNVGQYRLLSLNGLNKFFKNEIDLKRYVQEILSNNYDPNLQIYVSSEKYIRNLANITKHTQKDIIAYYIMYRTLAVLNFPSDDDDDKKTIQKAHCVKLVQQHFSKLSGYLYSQNFRKTKNEVEKLEEVKRQFDRIKKSLSDSFDRILTSNMKNAAQQKLTRFEATFPPNENQEANAPANNRDPNFWSKLKTIMRNNAKRDLERLSDPSRAEMSTTSVIEPFQVNVKLNKPSNEIIMGQALLQQPFYEWYYPESMKYAILGQRLARELIFAFDEQGFNSPQWDEYTAQDLKNRSECYRTQYSNYLYNNPENFRNALKLREIMADSSGLNLAFNAYLDWLGEPYLLAQNLVSETVPGVDFTNTQLFFIHFAQMRCAAKFGESTETSNLFPMDQHTSERYDVNGPLSNFEEFAREFNCQLGDKMHPDDKCELY